jgi:hypothetical protein
VGYEISFPWFVVSQFLVTVRVYIGGPELQTTGE